MVRLAGVFAVLATPALADLRVCNTLDTPASVAVGYTDDGTWTSEGWWRVRAGECETIFAGNLKHRFYYWRASTPNGPLPAESYTFCTSPEIFTIRGDETCEARGYDTANFTEVDTGDATDYVIVLETELAEEAPSSDAARDVYAALQGFWQDADDPAIEMLIDGTRLTDYFAGIDGAEASWKLADTCPGAGGAGPVMLVQYPEFGNDVLCWVLFELTERRMGFRAVGATSDVEMVRVR